ncbi:MAG TPA: transcriptional repressor LexA [Candidatus Paceibacterota bacterium]
MNKTEKKDLQGYAYIRNQIVHSGVTPSLRDIGRVVGYSSPRSAQLMLERLKKLHLISYSEGVYMLSKHNNGPSTEKTVDVPLVGSVACGMPSLAEQGPETLVRVSTKIARPGAVYFLLRATGTSMNKSGIKNGDLLLIRQQSTADEGERVVALIDDDATVKHLYHEKGVIILKPNSTDKSHKPIVLSDDFIIQGVVAAILPKSIL